MQLIQKLRDDQKSEEIELEYSRRSRSRKTISRNTGLHCYRVDNPYQFALFLLVGNIVTNSRVTPSWREIVSLTILYLNKVKEESERLNELELDDPEMDEDEKYNRKLESGLYSL
ncbi:hypothetical protein Tco_0557394 [Tanacetum coccineum]